MSSAAAGSRNDATQGKNAASSDVPSSGGDQNPAVCSTTSAEAEQGDGPAAASASAAGSSGGQTTTTAVSTSASTDYAAAACPVAVVAIGPDSAAAASEKCAASVSLTAASASGTAANAVDTSVLPEGTAEAYAEALAVFRAIRAQLDQQNTAEAVTAPAQKIPDGAPTAAETPATPSSDQPTAQTGQTQTERNDPMSTANADVMNRLDALEQMIKTHSVQDQVAVIKDSVRNITTQNQDIRNDILDLQREIMKSGGSGSAPAD